MTLKRNQSYIDFTVRKWCNTEFDSASWEMCKAAREYINDTIEVHKLVKLGKCKGGEWLF